MTIHWELWLAVVGIGALLVWLADKIEHRIANEVEALRLTVARTSTPQTAYPSHQEVIDAIDRVDERIGNIAIGLADWAKQPSVTQDAMARIESASREAADALTEMKGDLQTIALAQPMPADYELD